MPLLNTHILATSGKPVYSRHTHPPADLVGLIQAVVSSFASQAETLRTVEHGGRRLVFLVRPLLFLVHVCTLSEPVSLLRDHLNILYHHILSITTEPQLNRIFSIHPNYDLRQLLSSSHLDALVDAWQTELATVWRVIEPYPLKRSVRDQVSKILMQSRVKSLWYAVVVKGRYLVAVLRPNGQNLHPSDLHLLLHVMNKSRAQLRTSPTFLPVCLPWHDPTRFLYCYISEVKNEASKASSKSSPSTLPEKPDLKGKGKATEISPISPKSSNHLRVRTDTLDPDPLTLILISQDKEAHVQLREMAESAIPHLLKLDYGAFVMTYPKSPRSPKTPRSSGLQRSASWEVTYQPTNVLHWTFRSTPLVQVIQSSYEEWTETKSEDSPYPSPSLNAIYRAYRELSCKHSKTVASNSTKMVMVDQRHVLWRGNSFLLFVTHKTDVDKKSALLDANSIRRAIKAKEDELFIFHSPSF